MNKLLYRFTVYTVLQCKDLKFLLQIFQLQVLYKHNKNKKILALESL